MNQHEAAYKAPSKGQPIFLDRGSIEPRSFAKRGVMNCRSILRSFASVIIWRLQRFALEKEHRRFSGDHGSTGEEQGPFGPGRTE